MTRRRAAWALALCLGLVPLGALVVRAADPDALWKIVHDRCVPGARAGDPAPCADVDLRDGEARGSAVLKDLVGRTQFLLIPTARIAGIESPALLDPETPNYFADAWRARRFVEARAGRALPRDAVALAINARPARSQDQLHIHVDCLRPDVRDALRGQAIGEDWARLPAALAGGRYRAMRIPGERLDRSPFRLLAEGVPGARAAMADATLVVAGSAAPDGPGFILLAGSAGEEGGGHGESLLDHGCAAAAAP